MVKVKEIVPTDSFRRIAVKLGKDLEDFESRSELLNFDEEEIEDEINKLDVDDDAAFEFMDIFDKCKEHMGQGFVIQFKSPGVVEKDEFQMPSNVQTFDGPKTGRLQLQETFHHQLKLDQPLELKNKQPISSAVKSEAVKSETAVPQPMLTFGEVLNEISADGRGKLEKENLLHEVVLARITNCDFESLGLNAADLKILRDIVIQCRVQMMKKLNQPLAKTIRNHQIFKKMPFYSDETFQALENANIKSGNQLYLYTTFEKIHQVLRSGKIPAEDRKAILGGIGMAKYARKVLEHNRRQKIPRKTK